MATTPVERRQLLLIRAIVLSPKLLAAAAIAIFFAFFTLLIRTGTLYENTYLLDLLYLLNLGWATAHGFRPAGG